MQLQTLIRGGTLVDGTGADRRRADIGIAGGRIAVVAPNLREAADAVIDAGGLIVSPGFIDSHTHMETQLFWDKAAQPATWHGATTVVMGNCGLSLAPIGPAGHDFAAGLMSSVEQIPRAIIDEVVPFDWTTFGGYVSSVERSGLPVNAASFVGYSLVRHAVMGERAFDGRASDDDVDHLRRGLRAALQEGALGISYNRAIYDRDAEGRLMAGWDADWDEMRRTASVLKEFSGTMLQVIPSWAELSAGWCERNEIELAEWTRILADIDRPMVWSAVSERDFEAQMDATRRARAAGVMMTAGIHSIPIYTFATLAAPGLFASTPGCDALYDLSPRERIEALRDPAVRQRIRSVMGRERFVAYSLRHVAENGEVSLGMERTFDWSQIYDAGVAPDRFRLTESLADTARRDGRHPVDVLLDRALASDLRAVFVVFVYGNLPEVTRTLLLDPATVISSNDTGAHLMLMAQTQNTHLLDFWARQSKFLSLEQAVHLLSGRQADTFGLPDRGRLQPGLAADVIVFDEATVGPQAPQILDDLPGGGGSRYVSRGLGIERVIVNGETLLERGEPSGALPGRFLRPAAG